MKRAKPTRRMALEAGRTLAAECKRLAATVVELTLENEELRRQLEDKYDKSMREEAHRAS